MGGENRTNSGFGACEVTRRGVRSDGVQDAVDILSQYPGIDGFTCSFVKAGGRLEYRGGQYHMVGKTCELSPNELAKVVKMQTRVGDAVKKNLVVECERAVYRTVKSTGYRVAGSSVGGSVRQVSNDASVQLKRDNTEVMGNSGDAPLPVPVKSDAVRRSAMPADFMSEFLGSDD